MFPGFPWSLLKYTIIGLDSTCTCTHLQLRLTLKCFSICLVNEIIKYVNLVCVCFLEVLTTTRLNGVCSIRVYFYRWFLTVLTMENILTMLLCHCVPVWAYHTSLPALMATRPSWSATHHRPSLRMVWIVLYSISLVHKSICSGSDNVIYHDHNNPSQRYPLFTYSNRTWACIWMTCRCGFSFYFNFHFHPCHSVAIKGWLYFDCSIRLHYNVSNKIMWSLL